MGEIIDSKRVYVDRDSNVTTAFQVAMRRAGHDFRSVEFFYSNGREATFTNRGALIVQVGN